MAPPVDLFPALELPQRVQIVQEGFKAKRRKGGPFDPFSCPLYHLNQYVCEPLNRGTAIQCHTIVRLFRKCANGVMVETTALEAGTEKYDRGDLPKYEGILLLTTEGGKSTAHS